MLWSPCGSSNPRDHQIYYFLFLVRSFGRSQQAPESCGYDRSSVMTCHTPLPRKIGRIGELAYRKYAAVKSVDGESSLQSD